MKDKNEIIEIYNVDVFKVIEKIIGEVKMYYNGIIVSIIFKIL